MLVLAVIAAFFGWHYWQEEQRKAEAERKEHADKLAAVKVIEERRVVVTTFLGRRSFSIGDVIDRWNPERSTFLDGRGLVWSAKWAAEHPSPIGGVPGFGRWEVERREGPAFAVADGPYAFDVDILAHTIHPVNDLSKRLLALEGSEFTKRRK